MTNYMSAKNMLKETAKEVKRTHPKDKPAIRQTINDTADMLSKDLNLSDYERDQLANYACKLHPKD